MDISQFCDHMTELYNSRKPATNLKLKNFTPPNKSHKKIVFKIHFCYSFYMKFRKYFIPACFIFLQFLLLGCNSKIEVWQTDSNSVKIVFSGKSGKAFSKMIGVFDNSDYSGNSDSSDPESESFFNTQEIKQELLAQGFQQITIKEQPGANLELTMTDTNRQTFIFSSNLIEMSQNTIKLNLTAQTLKLFYTQANQQLKDLLDMFLCPIFNDEEMSENEYLETVASVYGQEFADEIRDCLLYITLNSLSGKTEKIIMPLSKLLTLK